MCFWGFFSPSLIRTLPFICPVWAFSVFCLLSEEGLCTNLQGAYRSQEDWCGYLASGSMVFLPFPGGDGKLRLQASGMVAGCSRPEMGLPWSCT